MHTTLDCIPCFVRQAIDSARACHLKEPITRRLLRDTLHLLQNVPLDRPPPLTGRDVFQLLVRITEDPDPYAAEKQHHTQTARDLLIRLREKIASSPDTLKTAVQYAISGNAIDLGVTRAHNPDVDAAFEAALTRTIDDEPIEQLRRSLDTASRILFLADNAGELVFDLPLLEQIGPDKLTIVVRGGPILNDVTRKDAERSGIPKNFRVIDNGSSIPGTWLPDCSDSFRTAFDAADLIISKGQGNFETLHEIKRPIFFLFLVKCAVVAAVTEKPIGTAVVLNMPMS